MYLVVIRHGLIQYGPDGYGWRVFGKARALRKASRVLARYRRRFETPRAVVVVTE
jgi:hypothetical protein